SPVRSAITGALFRRAACANRAGIIGHRGWLVAPDQPRTRPNHSTHEAEMAPQDPGPAGQRPMIVVDKLTKYYGTNPRPAADGTSCQVHTGEVLSFVAPNGAGKPTTMKILTSSLAPSGGQAAIAGFDVYEQSIEARRRIGYLPEDTPLYKDMSVLEYLE